MTTAYPIASIAELIGDPARSAILIALLDGLALPAGDLARLAGISAQSASGHLSKLVGGGLLAVHNSGRHRYYKIAKPEVAHALEALGAISTAHRPLAAPLDPRAKALYAARTCYDHLAGRVAVELARALESSKAIRSCGHVDYDLGPRGESCFKSLGLDVDSLRRSRRFFARRCIDWTERKPHLAGALGAALCSRLLALKWMVRRSGTRSLRITHTGAREFQSRFGITVPS
jgi:DNA-binding transcriptional ArsR family regulator